MRVYVIKSERFKGRFLEPGRVVDVLDARVPELEARGVVRRVVDETPAAAAAKPKQTNALPEGLPAGARVLVKL